MDHSISVEDHSSCQPEYQMLNNHCEPAVKEKSMVEGDANCCAQRAAIKLPALLTIGSVVINVLNDLHVLELGATTLKSFIWKSRIL